MNKLLDAALLVGLFLFMGFLGLCEKLLAVVIIVFALWYLVSFKAAMIALLIMWIIASLLIGFFFED